MRGCNGCAKGSSLPAGQLIVLYRSYNPDVISAGPHDVSPDDSWAKQFMLEADFGDGWLHPASSNYTFIVQLHRGSTRSFGVYKPRDGEMPLWDFPVGTLCGRETAAFELSELLRWSLVPPTVIREGEAGLGSVQLFVPHATDSNYFTIFTDSEPTLQRMAVFDIVANNADRKGGNCFASANSNTIWGVDHGLTFHENPKLRTVIWDFAGQSVPFDALQDLRSIAERFASEDEDMLRRFATLVSARELDAVRRRIDNLLAHPYFPSPQSRRDLPWPWI